MARDQKPMLTVFSIFQGRKEGRVWGRWDQPRLGFLLAALDSLLTAVCYTNGWFGILEFSMF